MKPSRRALERPVRTAQSFNFLSQRRVYLAVTGVNTTNCYNSAGHHRGRAPFRLIKAFDDLLQLVHRDALRLLNHAPACVSYGASTFETAD